MSQLSINRIPGNAFMHKVAPPPTLQASIFDIDPPPPIASYYQKNMSTDQVQLL